MTIAEQPTEPNSAHVISTGLGEIETAEMRMERRVSDLERAMSELAEAKVALALVDPIRRQTVEAAAALRCALPADAQEIAKERDQLRADLAAMTERAEDMSRLHGKEVIAVEQARAELAKAVGERDGLAGLVQWILDSVAPSDSDGPPRLTIRHSMGPNSWIEHVRLSRDAALADRIDAVINTSAKDPA